MRQLVLVAVISWACLGAPLGARQDPGNQRAEPPQTASNAQEGQSLQDAMDFVLAHLTDLQAQYATQGLQLTEIKRAVVRASSAARCELLVTEQQDSDTGRGRTVQSLLLTDKFPLAFMATAEARIGQAIPAPFAQTVTPPRMNMLILTASTPVIEEDRSSNRAGDPNDDRNGVFTISLVQRQVTYYASDEQILPRLAAALNRAIRLCGGKTEAS